jgi:peptidoglycan/LPS O-acetylase OafA/YrhL
MRREVRIVLWILAVLLLISLVTPAVGFYLPMVLLYYGWPLVLLAMAWGILDAAYHPDSVWRDADQNKVAWVLVQFIPLVGTMAYYILVHPTVLEAEDRVRRS